MATELYDDDNFTITRFYGGTARGLCLQITDKESGDYLQVPFDKLPMLQEALEETASSHEENDDG